MKPKVLLVEDNEAARFGFARYFSKEGYDVYEVGDMAGAVNAFAVDHFDAIILDINLPDGNGIDLIDTVRASDSIIPIIVITGSGDISLAVEAMQRGADNFLVKPIDTAALSAFLRKTIETGVIKRQLTARKRLDKQEDIFFGSHRLMNDIYDLVRITAASDSPILITGETGTGKGILARWIHSQSTRSNYEFVELNCSGLRGEMLSREIFGNVRGAFTSADRDRKGLLDIADHGTLFLDEIGDMSMDVQAQFLKVLEEKSYRRLGDVKLLKSNFRLICATNREIGALQQAGQFRQDLMFRINLLTFHLPPLRERMSDLPELADYQLRSLGATPAVLSTEIMKILMGYHWPGNIREFKNVLERALLLTPRGAILRKSLFMNLEAGRPTPSAHGASTIMDLELNHISTVLKQMGGNINKTAKSLDISRATLYRRIKQINAMNE